MIDPVYIPDVINNVVTKTQNAMVNDTQTLLQYIRASETTAKGATDITALNFQFGHYNELIEKLINADKAPDTVKYPLIWLRTDFRERRGQQLGVYAEVYLNIIIGHFTKGEIRSEERLAKVFKPVLYPIYYEFMNQLYLNGLSFAYDGELIPHDKYDRYYWGNQQLGKTSDYIDAIEIDNLVLKINYSDCYKTDTQTPV